MGRTVSLETALIEEKRDRIIERLDQRVMKHGYRLLATQPNTYKPWLCSIDLIPIRQVGIRELKEILKLVESKQSGSLAAFPVSI